MIERAFTMTLRELLRHFPAVTILGARQCGKTTFIRQALPDWTYLDLERPADATPLEADPEARLSQLGNRLILDEAQAVPGLFPVLRGVIDRGGRRSGSFVLLGSASPALVRGISESLAGRTACLDLPPFRWDEVRKERRAKNLATLWLRGGYPRAFLAPSDTRRTEWLEAYTRAFVERDLPALGVDVSTATMRKLWTMLAHVQGGLWNASQLAASLGVSYHTVNRYVDILEQAFLVLRLSPYFANVGKRLVKSPKMYFRDSGLLHYFLGVRSAAELEVHPARGASWEGFIVDHLLSAYRRLDPSRGAWFWRTAQGDEVDLLVETRSGLIPFEIKLHSAPTAEHASGVSRCMSLLGLDRGYVVHSGAERYSLGKGVTAVPAQGLLNSPGDLAAL
jgi:uncharacterized protein